MSHPVGDSASVLELARLFRREARKVNELQTRAERRTNSTHWVGKRATRTKSGVRAQGHRISNASSELKRMAGLLEEHAEWIRRTTAHHEDLERRIRWWANNNPPNPETPGPDASWIKWWPERHSFSWPDLARQLWSAGAYF